MAQRGRKSTAALQTVGLVAPVIQEKRVVPPATLGDAERQVWAEVVNDQPANAFTATHIPQLEMYCRHVTQARLIADELLNFDRSWLADQDGLRRYDTLLKMHERESRAASSFATRLRITRQAIDQQTVARGLLNKKTARKPWEMPLTIDEDD